MRPRTVVPWVLLPPLVVVIVAAWAVDRVVHSERAPVSELAARAAHERAVSSAHGAVAGELVVLIALDAFTHVPPSLSLYALGTEAWDQSDFAMTLHALRAMDADGPRLLEPLRAGGDLAPAIESTLALLPPRVDQDIEAGRTGFVDPGPYAAALRALEELQADAFEHGVDIEGSVAALADRPAYAHTPGFLVLTVAMVALASAGGALSLWRVNRRTQAVGGQLALADERNAQLRAIIDCARRLSTESDSASLSRRLVAEIRALFPGDLAVLLRREGELVVPVETAGTLRVPATGFRGGTIEHCLDAAVATRAVVAGDPLFVEVGGSVSILTAPLAADGKVFAAIAVAARSREPFNENDEAALQLLALLAAGAMTAAQRLDSTVALTLHDPLTGLANRRRLDRDLSSCAIGSYPVAFLMVDIDHFKSFNDTHGHQRGDELLVVVGHAISSAVRETDVVYRYGGEEFCVLLLQTDATTALQVAQRVRTAVPLAAASVTVSVGVAAQQPPVSPHALIANADEALYVAKQTGRDRVHAMADAERSAADASRGEICDVLRVEGKH